MKYTMQGAEIDYHGKNGSKIIYEFEAVDIKSFLEHVWIFMRGCGFVFDGDLEIVDNSLPSNDKDME